MILAVYTGDMEEGARVMQPLRDIAAPVADLVGPIPYPVIYDFTEPATHPHFLRTSGACSRTGSRMRRWGGCST